LQYLYLLFDEAPNTRLGNTVFSTEGHPLSLSVGLQKPIPKARRALHRGEFLQCPAYRPPRRNGLIVGIEQRSDYDYARSLVYGPELDGTYREGEEQLWDGSGTCEMPSVPRFVSYSFVDGGDIC
jgi:mannosidase alpha-like ER degradation enhancer 1